MILRQWTRVAYAVLAGVAVIASAVQAQDKQSGSGQGGELAFNNACRTCHTVKESDNRLGPNLHAIIGRKAGSVPNYPYSEAMKTSDLTWDRATLDRYIKDPDAVVRDNRMKPYGGLASAEERAKIIAYLEAQQ